MQSQTSYYNSNGGSGGYSFNHQPTWSQSSNSNYLNYNNSDPEKSPLLTEPERNSIGTSYNNRIKKKKTGLNIFVKIFVIIFYLVSIALVSIGLYHYLIPDKRKLEINSILYFVGGVLVFIVTTIVLISRKCSR